MNDSDIYMLVTEEKIDPRIISANFNISLDRINQIVNKKSQIVIKKRLPTIVKHNIRKPVQGNKTVKQSEENAETGSAKMEKIRKNYQLAYQGNSLPKKKKKISRTTK